MELLQFVCELCIRLVEQTFLRHQRAKPIENDLLVGIILSNFPHNTQQTLYAHVTRGNTHTRTQTQMETLHPSHPLQTFLS